MKNKNNSKDVDVLRRGERKTEQIGNPQELEIRNEILGFIAVPSWDSTQEVRPLTISTWD